MPRTSLPPLYPDEWRGTRSALHAYARVAGAIRGQLAPPEKHWYHVSLRTCARGLITPPIAGADGTFDISIDLPASMWVVATSTGQEWRTPLTGQSAERLCAETLNVLSLVDLEIELDAESFGATAWADYDRDAVTRYWNVLLWMDVVLKYFKASLHEETSPVQLWPHHFDLALLWLSGRRVPGEDPADFDRADEQMNFGFVPGDDDVAEPYVYATAYPQPAGYEDLVLPEGARWHASARWQGAMITYEYLRHVANPATCLLEFLHAAFAAGASAMAERVA